MQRYPDEKPIELGLGWEKVRAGVDLDIQCVVFDSLGVVIDACFFNNPRALGGAMVLSGDCKDGSSVAGGADEKITIDLPRLPPHAATIMCAVFCTSEGSSLGDVADLHVSVRDPIQNQDIISVPVQGNVSSATGYVAVQLLKDYSFRKEWTISVTWDFLFNGTVRNFVEALPQMQSHLEVRPELQAELISKQPVFNVKKGQTYDMPAGLNRVGFGLGWDSKCDVDASLVALSSMDRNVISKISFMQLQGCDGAVQHHGDNVTGEGDGDDETITVDLNRVPEQYTHLFLMVNIYTMNHKFTDVDGEFIRVYNDLGKKKKEFLRYDHLDDSGPVNGVIVGCLWRHQSELMCKLGGAHGNNTRIADGWGFTALNIGAQGNTCNDLVDECQDLMRVGLNTERYYALPHRAAEKLRPKPRAQNESVRARGAVIQKSAASDGCCCAM